MSTADRPPRNVSLFGTWRVAILLSVCSVRLTWLNGNAPRPLHLTQTFQDIGNPETSTQSIVCRDMGFRREGLIQTAVMGSWIVRKGRSAETGWLFAVEAG